VAPDLDVDGLICSARASMEEATHDNLVEPPSEPFSGAAPVQADTLETSRVEPAGATGSGSASVTRHTTTPAVSYQAVSYQNRGMIGIEKSLMARQS